MAENGQNDCYLVPKWPLYDQNDRYGPKWPIAITKMTVIWNSHQNDRYSTRQQIIGHFGWKWYQNDRYLKKKTLKWPLFMFERLHWCWRLNVLALFGHDFFKLTVIFIYLKTVVQKTKNKGHFVQNNGHFGITVIVVLNLRSFWYFLTFILVATHLTP